MKIYILTDLEGVGGVLNYPDWCRVDSPNIAKAQQLLADEVNAAIAGFARGGFDEFVVMNGHGCGIVDELIDKRAKIVQLEKEVEDDPDYTFLMDSTFDAFAVIGQHAKAGTPFSHICHTGAFKVIDKVVNGISVGEFADMAIIAGELGIPAIFASGELTFTKEARELYPNIFVAATKEGTSAGRGDDLAVDEYIVKNSVAIHYDHAAVLAEIESQAEKAALALQSDRSRFNIIELDNRKVLDMLWRQNGDEPPRKFHIEVDGTYAALRNREHVECWLPEILAYRKWLAEKKSKGEI